MFLREEVEEKATRPEKENKKRLISKYLPLVVFCLGLFLILYGMYRFLMPIDYTGTTRREEFHEWDFHVPRGQYRWGIGQARFSWIWLDWGLNYTVKVEEDLLIDLYVLNESQFAKWVAGSRDDSMFFETGSYVTFAFYPVQEVDYYFVLDNTKYSYSKTLHVTSTFFEILPTFDFNKALDGIRTAVVGLPILILGLILLIKQHGEVLGRPLKFNIFPHASETKIGRRGSRWLSIFFWIFLIIAWTAPLILVYWMFPVHLLENLWPEIRPMFLDAYVRFVLNFSLLLTPLPFLYLTSAFLTCQALNLACWIHETKRQRRFNRELEVNAFELFRRKMISLKSVIVIATLVAFQIIIHWFFEWGYLVQFIASPAILSIVEGYNLFSSYVEASRNLGLRWRKEFRIERMLARTRITFMFFLLPVLTPMLFWIFRLLIEPIYNLVWLNCPLVQFASPAFELIHMIQVEGIGSLVQNLASDYFLLNAVGLAVLGFGFCYILPKISVKRLRWRTLRRFLPPLISFFVIFASQEVYAKLMDAEALHVPYLLIAFLTFLVTYFISEELTDLTDKF